MKASRRTPAKKSSRPAKRVAPKKRRGLLFDPSDLPRIRANTKDPRFAEYWQTLLATDMAADTAFLTTELSLTNHVAHLLRAQRILDRTSLIYLVNRDPAQLALAKLAIRRMLDYPEWDSFIEGGKQIRRRAGALHAAQLQPLGGKIVDQRPRARIGLPGRSYSSLRRISATATGRSAVESAEMRPEPASYPARR